MEYSKELLQNTSTSDLKAMYDFIKEKLSDPANSIYRPSNEYQDLGESLNGLPSEIDFKIKNRDILRGEKLVLKTEIDRRIFNIFPL